LVGGLKKRLLKNTHVEKVFKTPKKMQDLPASGSSNHAGMLRSFERRITGLETIFSRSCMMRNI
jgi:hypothetical protein